MTGKKVHKVPVLLQMEALECGAASLCMILAYYGKWLPLEQVRTDCGVSRDGSNAKNILVAARSYGMTAKGIRTDISGLYNIKLPAIIHWNFNHFVVLNGFKKNRAFINDPAKGLAEIPMDEFEIAFTGIVLCFEPGESFKPEGHAPSILSFVVKRMGAAKSAILFVVLTVFLTTLFGTLLPFFSRIFMDDILSGNTPEWLLPFISMLGCLAILQFIVNAVQCLGMYRIKGRFAITASSEYIWHILHLPMEFFAQRWAGDLLNRQKSNDNISAVIIEKTAPVIVNLVFLIVYLAVMLHYSIVLTAIGVAASILNILSARWAAHKVMNANRLAQSSQAKATSSAVAAVDMIESIKAAGAESGFFERWAGYYAINHNTNVQIAKTTNFFSAIPAFLAQFASIAVLLTGVYLILSYEMTIGMLLAFQGFLSSFLKPVDQIGDMVQSMSGQRVEMERVEDVMKYKAEAKNQGKNDEVIGKLKGGLELKNITFGYSRLADPLISDFSITLKPASSVAFVGVSGCGKSTLAKLITGLYKPWKGEILFDGRPRDEIDDYTFHSSIAMIDQDITMFHDKISENIRMWDDSIENFAVIMAAKNADMHETIAMRPGGYDSMVQDGGSNFSGGERQRLEIARVLAMEPTIVIMDEGTSALDAKTEALVMRNIRLTGATCVIIAHRLSTIRDCDEIIVLDQGRIVERGTHEQLMAMDSIYASLVTVE